MRMPGIGSSVAFLLVMPVMFAVTVAGCQSVTGQAASAAEDKVFGVPSSFQPSYTALSEDEKQDKGLLTVTPKIRVPAGLSTGDLEANIRYASRAFYETHHPDRMTVLAFKEGTSHDGTDYTAGRAVFAPARGQDLPAGAPLDKFALTVDLKDSYKHSEELKPPSRLGDPRIVKAEWDYYNASQSVRKKLDETARRSLFIEITQEEYKAALEAEKQYPSPSKDASSDDNLRQAALRNKRYDELQDQYDRLLAQKHSLSEEELHAVRREGVDQGWVMPGKQLP